jgi:hypothetical protein
MLKPAPIREVKGDRPRMWMMDPYMDLIVWYLPDGGLYGFQLCYDKGGDERSLTWLHTGVFTHTRMDSGEAGPLDAKATPMPVAGGLYDYDEVRRQFQKRSALIDPKLSEFVLLKLGEANLAKLPAAAGLGIFLKQEGGETGPVSEAELLELLRYSGLSSGQLLRFEGESGWRRISEFFPDQFPSAPRAT